MRHTQETGEIMPRGRRTDLQRAATAKAMHEMGFQAGQIGEAVSLPEATVDDIVNGRHGWSKMQNDPVFSEYRVQQKRFMQTSSIELAKKSSTANRKQAARSQRSTGRSDLWDIAGQRTAGRW